MKIIKGEAKSMCNILGIINFKGNIVYDINLLKKMMKTLKNGGQGVEGSYISSNVLLGYKENRVIYHEGEVQPIIKNFQGKKYVAIYDGELHEAADLRRSIQKQGLDFESYSDVELIINSYILWGKSCVNKLKGVFRFCVFDESSNEVFLARGNNKEKLFYVKLNDSVIFALEEDIILRIAAIKIKVQNENMDDIFKLEGQSLFKYDEFKYIKELKPTNCMLVTKENDMIVWDYLSAEERM